MSKDVGMSNQGLRMFHQPLKLLQKSAALQEVAAVRWKVAKIIVLPNCFSSLNSQLQSSDSTHNCVDRWVGFTQIID